MRLVTVAQMRQIEKEAFACGISYEQMMRTAGVGIAEEIIRAERSEKKSICGLIGSGNNGGDALIALTELAEQDWQVTAWLVSTISDENQEILTEFQKSGGIYTTYAIDSNFKQLDAWIEKSEILLDGVLGIGCQLPLRPDFTKVFSHILSIPQLPYCIAVDCPSGIDCDSGAADPFCLQADRTICIEAVKMGEILHPSSQYTGTLSLVSLNLPKNLAVYSEIMRSLLDQAMMKSLLPARKPEGHKGTFGTVSIFGGSEGYIGAPVLAGLAAYRIGCGLVKMFTPAVVRNLSAGPFPEATWTVVDFSNGKAIEKAIAQLIETSHRNGAVLIGPGIGLTEESSAFVRRLLEELGTITPYLKNAMVIDADGLSLMAENPNWFSQISENCVLTPHPGEMARLTGYSIEDIQANRLVIAEKFAVSWKKTVVLKGANTVVAAADGCSAVLPIASSALAKAGSGDILAGVIAGLLAQSDLSAFDAACLGVWLHGMAGLNAQAFLGNPYSTMASDILNSIPEAINELLM